MSKKTLLWKQSVHIKVRGKLLSYEKEALLHEPTTTNLQLAHPTSIRVLNDRKAPEPLGALLRNRPQIQTDRGRLQIALVQLQIQNR